VNKVAQHFDHHITESTKANYLTKSGKLTFNPFTATPLHNIYRKSFSSWNSSSSLSSMIWKIQILIIDGKYSVLQI